MYFIRHIISSFVYRQQQQLRLLSMFDIAYYYFIKLKKGYLTHDPKSLILNSKIEREKGRVFDTKKNTKSLFYFSNLTNEFAFVRFCVVVVAISFSLETRIDCFV